MQSGSITAKVPLSRLLPPTHPPATHQTRPTYPAHHHHHHSYFYQTADQRFTGLLGHHPRRIPRLPIPSSAAQNVAAAAKRHAQQRRQQHHRQQHSPILAV